MSSGDGRSEPNAQTETSSDLVFLSPDGPMSVQDDLPAFPCTLSGLRQGSKLLPAAFPWEAPEPEGCCAGGVRAAPGADCWQHRTTVHARTRGRGLHCKAFGGNRVSSVSERGAGRPRGTSSHVPSVAVRTVQRKTEEGGAAGCPPSTQPLSSQALRVKREPTGLPRGLDSIRFFLILAQVSSPLIEKMAGILLCVYFQGCLRGCASISQGHREGPPRPPALLSRGWGVSSPGAGSEGHPQADGRALAGRHGGSGPGDTRAHTP